MDQGWIRWHRSVLSSYLVRMPGPQFKVANLLALSAAWRETDDFRGGERVPVLRGELTTTIRELSEKFHESPRTIRTALANLEKAGFLRHETRAKGGKRFTLISLVNYDTYNPEDKTPTKGRSHHAPRDRHNTDTTPTNHPSIEEEKKECRAKSPTSSSSRSAVPNADAIAETCVATLNKLKGSSYRADSEKTQKLSRALARSKHTPEQVERVVRAKCAEWLQDPKMQKYLRPSTLLALDNFQGYLDDLAGSAGGHVVKKSSVPWELFWDTPRMVQ